jgi:hypothetical protein
MGTFMRERLCREGQPGFDWMRPGPRLKIGARLRRCLHIAEIVHKSRISPYIRIDQLPCRTRDFYTCSENFRKPERGCQLIIIRLLSEGNLKYVSSSTEQSR